MFQFGFCAWLLSGKSLPDKIDFLDRAGFNSLTWLQSVMTEDPVERAEAAAAIREKHFTLTYHGNVQNSLTPKKKLNPDFIREMFDDVLWWHKNTNGVVSCCSDTIAIDGVYLQEETHRLFRLEQEFFAPEKIGYGIENSPSAGRYSEPEEMESVRKMLNDPPGAGMILDAGHAHVYLTQNKGCGMDLADYICRLPFRIYEVHITDNHGTADEHLLPGMGTLDFRQLRAGLEARGFDGVISLEVCPDIRNGVYCWDLSRSDGRDMVLRARDAFFKAYGL